METPSNYHGHPAFYRIVEELKELHSEKNRQYATKDNPLRNFERTGKMISKFLKPGIDPTLASCLALVSKQIDGVYELVGECKENTADSLEDKLRDIADVYDHRDDYRRGVTGEEVSHSSSFQERAGQFYRPETPVSPVQTTRFPPDVVEERHAVAGSSRRNLLTMRIKIRKVGPSEVYLVTRIEARLLDELRFPSLSVEHIAARIGITDDTAENLLRKLRKELKLTSRDALVRWWNRRKRIKYATGRTA